MKKFLLVYRGAVQPEDGQKHMAAWMSWVHGMGEAMIDPGTPVYPSQTISSSAITETKSDNPICGVSIIEAEDQIAAFNLIKPCPHLSIGGTIEVTEAIDCPMT